MYRPDVVYGTGIASFRNIDHGSWSDDPEWGLGEMQHLATAEATGRVAKIAPRNDDGGADGDTNGELLE